VRRIIRLCDDEAYLFDSTIEANLRIGCPDASGERLRAALAAVRLLDWVDTLPDGLATGVGEHGVRLSCGQRRRLSLARALLGDPPVLILDEPTEHLDEETADAVTRDLLAATTGRTTLLITHRRTGLDEVDEVVELSEGKVAQVTRRIH
jgi:ATP-binding cassette subfamily C protein CydCD